jgi:hypothetical protein
MTMKTYRSTTATTRSWGALLAALVGLLPLWLLLAGPQVMSPRRQAGTIVISMRLLPLPATRRLPPSAAPVKPSVLRTRERQSATPDAVALTAPLSSAAAASATEPVAVAIAASGPASAPLNLHISKALLAGTRS